MLAYQVEEYWPIGLNLMLKTGIILLKRKEDNMTNKKKKMTQSEMQKKIKELELQNLRLRVENEYLKKLDALVMERKKKELKK